MTTPHPDELHAARKLRHVAAQQRATAAEYRAAGMAAEAERYERDAAEREALAAEREGGPHAPAGEQAAHARQLAAQLEQHTRPQADLQDRTVELMSAQREGRAPAAWALEGAVQAPAPKAEGDLGDQVVAALEGRHRPRTVQVEQAVQAVQPTPAPTTRAASSDLQDQVVALLEQG